MSEMRKITAILPSDLLDSAMRLSGASLTDTLREALRNYSHHAASQKLLEMRGKVAFDLDWRALRGKDED